MQNKTAKEIMSAPHGASRDYQFSMTTRQLTIARILAEQLGIKVTEDSLVQFEDALNVAGLLA